MNINEIAQLAGVSRATVSRYLNDGYVSEEKREKIRRVIQETGYQPSSQAQMLRTKKTRLIGVIIPKINSDSVSRMVAGISQVLQEEGYEMLLANTENRETEELKYLRLFAENKVDGIILIGTIFSREHHRALKKLQVPLVILGQKLDGYSCVYQDDFQAAKELTEILLQRGTKVGYIGVTESDEAAGHGRKEGYQAALAAAGDQAEARFMEESSFQAEGGYQAAQRLWRQAPELDAVFCATDTIALGAMAFYREQGKRIPEDMILAGIGDSTAGKIVLPKLSTVHFYYKTSGLEAARMLMQMLEEEQTVPKSMKMGYGILLRGSTERKAEDKKEKQDGR